jgi:hypothetical protein
VCHIILASNIHQSVLMFRTRHMKYSRERRSRTWTGIQRRMEDLQLKVSFSPPAARWTKDRLMGRYGCPIRGRCPCRPNRTYRENDRSSRMGKEEYNSNIRTIRDIRPSIRRPIPHLISIKTSFQGRKEDHTRETRSG